MISSGERGAHNWIVVIMLVAAYALYILDRQVVSMLVEPLKRDVGLTDTEIGILQGPAFGIFYALLGLPCGWLADRVNRVRLIAGGILLWSLATLGSGFVSSFGMLLVFRCLLGIGAATLVPAAVSVISDLFTVERRAMPLSVFTAGVAIGAGLALLLGGGFVAYAGGGATSLPLIGPRLATMSTWQIVFVLTGLLGLPLVPAMLLVPEPARAGGAGAPAMGGTLPQTLEFMWTRRRLFGPLLLATCCLWILGGAVGAWYPAMFMRRFDWSASEVGASLGVVIMACAIAGNVASGALATRRARKGVPNPMLSTMRTGAMLLLPLAVATPLLPGAAATLAGGGGVYVAMSVTFGVATATFAAYTPGAYRGQVIAIYILLGNLVGLGLGPTGVGLIIDHAGPVLGQIGPALAALCAVVTLPATLLLTRVARRETYDIQA